MLKGKTVVLGVCGSIAAYKIADLVSKLKKAHADVHVIMTRNATNFINPITFETLTGHKCLVETFDRNFEFNVKHVSLAKKADLFMIAPATANIIGKMANGICDDMLTTTFMACKGIKIIVPTMNTDMYDNPILQANLDKIKEYTDCVIVEPVVGQLACGSIGKGCLPSIDFLYEKILYYFYPKDLSGVSVLITAGPTQEPLDPVRYITNHSSGKMGFAIARNAYLRGARVTVVSGPVDPNLYEWLKRDIQDMLSVTGIEVKSVKSAKEMFDTVQSEYASKKIIIMAAAVADYTPVTVAENKMKKSDDDLSIPLKRTTDILKYVGENKSDNQVLIGFSMETENLIENSKKKLEKKNADMICANSLNDKGAGFRVDTDLITLIKKDSVVELPFDTKENLASKILDEAKAILESKNESKNIIN